MAENYGLNKILSSSQSDRLKITKSVSKVAAYTRDTMIGLGLAPPDPCNITSFWDEVTRMVEDWWEELKDVWDSLMSYIGGNFFVSLVALLATVLGASAFAWLNETVGDFIAGNLIGTLMSVVAIGLTILPGVEGILQYYAVKRLKEALEKRSTLIAVLSGDMAHIINILRLYQKAFQDGNTQNFSHLYRAVQQLKEAERLLGVEVGRMNGTNTQRVKAIQQEQLLKAENNINKAMNEITLQQYEVFVDEIQKVTNDFKLRTKPPNNTTDISAWLTYFEKLQVELYDTFFTFNAQPGSLAYEEEKRKKLAQYRDILYKLLPFLPSVLRAMLLQSSYAAISDRLIQKIPVWINNSAFGSVKSFMDDAFKVPQEILMDISGQKAPTIDEPRILTDPETRDKTLRDFTTEVKVAETIILLFPQMFTALREVGNIYSKLVFQALEIVQTTRKDIEGTIEGGIESELELLGSKAKWLAELSLAKTWLKPMTGEQAGLQVPGTNQHLNGLEALDFIERVGLAMVDLENFIVAKAYDERTEKSKKEPIDAFFEIAQKALVPLLSGSAISMSPHHLKSLLASLQSLRILLDLQYKLDRSEISLCLQFMQSVEAHPAFEKARRILEDFLGDISNSPLSDMVNQISQGDVSEIVAYYETADAIVDIVKMWSCDDTPTDKPPFWMDSVVEGMSLSPDLSPGELRVRFIQDKMEESLTYMNTKKMMLQMQTEEIITKYENAKRLDEEATELSNKVPIPSAARINKVQNVQISSSEDVSSITSELIRDYKILGG